MLLGRLNLLSEKTLAENIMSKRIKDAQIKEWKNAIIRSLYCVTEVFSSSDVQNLQIPGLMASTGLASILIDKIDTNVMRRVKQDL